MLYVEVKSKKVENKLSFEKETLMKENLKQKTKKKTEENKKRKTKQ